MLPVLLFAAAVGSPGAFGEGNEVGFVPLFDGGTLDGWDGDAARWAVEDGVIVGRSTEDDPLPFNTFLHRPGPAGDFELRLDYKIESGNSGVQYRSTVSDAAGHRVVGPQADIDSSPRYTGIHYSEGRRGIVALCGQIVEVTADGENRVVGTCGDPAVLQKRFVGEGGTDGWNTYRIVAAGQTVSHFINDQLMCEVTDRRPDAERDGVIALQLHRGPPMVVRFRDVRLKQK